MLLKESKDISKWQHKKEKLKAAGLWAFIEGFHSRPWPDLHYVLLFVMTMKDMTIEEIETSVF